MQLFVYFSQLRERVIESYGLAQNELDEGWKVEGEVLKKILKPSSGESALIFSCLNVSKASNKPKALASGKSKRELVPIMMVTIP